MLVVKNPPANAGDARDAGLIPGLGRSPEGGNGNPLLYSCLENSLGRGAWWATVHGATKSQTSLSNWAHTYISITTTEVYEAGDSGRQSNEPPPMSISWSLQHGSIVLFMANGTLPMCWRVLRQGIVLDYQSGHNVVASVFVRRRQDGKICQKKKMWQWNQRLDRCAWKIAEGVRS